MTRQQKNDLINNLSSEFQESNAIIIADYKGITHKNLESLRNLAREFNVKVKIAKNSLVEIAIKNANLEEITLKDTNIFLWSEDQISACKVADKFSTKMDDKFNIKNGLIEGKVKELNIISSLAKLPGKDELLSMLAATWTAPIRNFTIGLNALKNQKEETQ